MEGQAEADAGEKFQAHVAVAGGLRGEGECDQGHNDGGDGVHELAPPFDFIVVCLLLVVFKMLDVCGQRGERHLVGIDQQYVEQAAAYARLPVFAVVFFGTDAVAVQDAAADVCQFPASVCRDDGGFCLPAFGQFEVLVVAEDFDAAQALVGQHFAHVDDVILLFNPQPLRAGADFAVFGCGFQVLGVAVGGGGDAFAQKGGGDGEYQAEPEQDGDDVFGTHAAGFDDGHFAVGGKLAQGNQAADEYGQGHHLVGVVGDLQQDVLHHFDACVAAFAHAAHFGNDVEEAV